MNAAAIVRAVTRYGVELRAVGDRVQCRPVDRLPEELRAALREHSATVADYLRSAATRALPTDPDPPERICAWCRQALDEDRDRLCRRCTGDAGGIEADDDPPAPSGGTPQ